jgi:putative aldouronate transport system permease protein
MVVTDVWKGFGFGSVIYLAALTSIDPALYEAAMVDGANRWKQTLHITLPGMFPIIVLLTVLSMANILNGGFDQIYNMYSPVVMETGDILDTFVFRLGIERAQFALSTAAGFFKSIVSLVFIILSYYLADRAAGYRVF